MHHRPARHACALRLVRHALLVTLTAASGAALAWSNHAQGSWPALATLPEVAQAAPVPAESLDRFLAAQADKLVAVLAQEEEWARQHVPTYPPLPAALRFRSDGATPAQLRERFVAALRLNPASRLTLFQQLPPGQPALGRPTLAWDQITSLKRDETIKKQIFLALRDGDLVPVLDVLATASDEPDYGLDIGLWEDNGTEHGRRYAMGKQPFGNPALEFASQAPLHMGFFHEAGIIYKAAPFLERTYPEYRVHLYATLARFALRSGHPYWGWRFAGWALHYLQDLTQPYHARVLPGVSVPRMLWINTVDLVGWGDPKRHAITLVSNRHLALENYQLHRVTRASLAMGGTPGSAPDALLAALRDTAGDAGAVYSPAAIRASITREAVARADALDAALEKHLPARYISDPDYTFGESEAEPDLAALLAARGPAAAQALDATLGELLGSFGRHSRAFVRALLVGER